MLLPKENIERFIGTYFQNQEQYLRILDFAPSPQYILETDVLARRARQFAQSFREQIDDCRFFFAVKSNNHRLVAQTVLKEDFGLDVSSGQELKMALELGAQDILFTGPGKTEDELRLAVENSDRITLLIDSPHELQNLENMAATCRKSVRAGVRLCPNPTGLWRKFGIGLADLLDFFKQAANCPHVDLQGLQFHTSWNLTPQAQTDFIGILGRALTGYPPSLLKTIRFLDIGGGYWPQPGEWLHADPAANIPAESHDVRIFNPSAPLTEFAREIRKKIKSDLDFLMPFTVYFEPGRWICNDSMHLIMTVVDKKAADLVIVNAGINAVGWERFETDYCPVLNLSRPSLTEKACLICGSLCTPHDIFGYSYFGEDIQIGDILFIPCQGAYTYSLKQTFIKPVPEVVVLSGGSYRKA